MKVASMMSYFSLKTATATEFSLNLRFRRSTYQGNENFENVLREFPTRSTDFRQRQKKNKKLDKLFLFYLGVSVTHESCFFLLGLNFFVDSAAFCLFGRETGRTLACFFSIVTLTLSADFFDFPKFCHD